MSSHHELIKRFADELERWDYNIDRLEHRIKDLPADLSKKLERKAELLYSQRDKLRNYEQELAKASGEMVADIEKNLEEAWSLLRVLFEDLELDVKVEVS